MPARVHRAFASLSARLNRHWAGDQRIWWASAPGSTDYTVPITARQLEERGASQTLTGLLTMPDGALTLHAEKAHFPHPPRENSVFLYGVSGSAKKYIITSVQDMDWLSHYVISAKVHS